MHEFIRAKRREHAQQAANLMLTREAIACVRLARTLAFTAEVHTELFRLAQSCAKLEWGTETFIDDFALPGKFLVQRGKLEEEI